MNYTDRFHLKKPEGTNPAAVDDINDNMDDIDEAMPMVVYSASEPAEPVEGMIWLKPIGE